VADGLALVGGEPQPAGVDCLGQQLGQPRLVEPRPPGPQPLQLGLVVVVGDHVMPDAGQARRRDQPDVPGTDDRNLHAWRPSCWCVLASR
jgi:hypothetical protein